MKKKLTYEELKQKLQERKGKNSEIIGTQKKLQKGNDYYLKLLEGVPELIYSFSTTNGGIYYSSQFKTILGYSASYLLDNPMVWHDSIHPDDLKKVNNIIHTSEEGKIVDIEYRIKNVAGNWCWLRDQSIGRRVNKDEIIIDGIATDITKYKKLEKKQSKLSSILKERVKELNCFYAISKIAEYEHLTIGALIQHVVDIIPSSFQYPDITCAIIHVNNAIAKTKFFKETKWKISAPIYAVGQNIGSLEIFLVKEKSSLKNKLFLNEEKKLSEAICERTGKIIERIQGTKKLQEVETRYRLLTNQFADGITIIQNDEYKFVNTAFSTMTGYSSPKYLIGKKYHSCISKDFIKLYNDSVFIETDADDIQDTIEYKLLSNNGNEIWVEEKRNIIDWEFAPALLCTLRDITEIKKKEAFSTQETNQLRNENILLRSSLKERYRFQNIIGISPPMQKIYDQILTAANSNASISIDGESGTGKELVAKAIHDLSNRKAGTFVTINCGAVPEPLIESEFFGYKKGSFTGAVIDKHGFLDLADKGTLFLDEIGELSLNMQVKLLRALDGGGYNPIGSNERHLSDFRIIAATNKNLKEEVVKGNIREDFYYRIQVIPINLPPLRKRKEDIPFLVEHFTQMFSKGSPFQNIPDNIVTQIYRYDWPGNIRELQNVLLRYFSTGDFEVIDPKKKKVSARADRNHEVIHGEHHSLNISVEKNEKELIIEGLKTNNWHRINTAAQLGISRSTLFRRLKKYGLLLKHTAQY